MEGPTGPTGSTGRGFNDQQISILDYFGKRAAASKVKTDSLSSRITVFNELNYTSTTVTGDNVWLDEQILYQGPTISISKGVAVAQRYVKMVSIHGVGEARPDNPDLIGISWKAPAINWIEPKFHELFSPNFVIGPTTSSNYTVSPSFRVIGSNYKCPFIFDYKTGILTFLSSPTNTPFDLTSKTVDPGTGIVTSTYSVWIDGYTYSGRTLDQVTPTPKGINWADYLYWDSVASKWAVGDTNITLGAGAGQYNQQSDAIAIGDEAGRYNQQAGAISIGGLCGHTGQMPHAIAIGVGSGYTDQQESAIAIGQSAGQNSQKSGCISIGTNAGNDQQGPNSIAIGADAGANEQKNDSLAIGNGAGNFKQEKWAIAIGNVAGNTEQGVGAVAFGNSAGQAQQGQFAIAIGDSAGRTGQKPYALAIGHNAGALNQEQHSIIINATGNEVNGVADQVSSFYVAPIREDNTATTLVGLGYNPETYEIVQSTTLGGGGLINGTNWGDYLYWDSRKTKWVVGDTNITLGAHAGETGQQYDAIAIGDQAGQYNQQSGCLAIGRLAGFTGQMDNAVAVGAFAGSSNQHENSIAIGLEAGRYDQGTNSSETITLPTMTYNNPASPTTYDLSSLNAVPNSVSISIHVTGGGGAGMPSPWIYSTINGPTTGFGGGSGGDTSNTFNFVGTETLSIVVGNGGSGFDGFQANNTGVTYTANSGGASSVTSNGSTIITAGGGGGASVLVPVGIRTVNNTGGSGGSTNGNSATGVLGAVSAIGKDGSGGDGNNNFSNYSSYYGGNGHDGVVTMTITYSKIKSGGNSIAIGNNAGSNYQNSNAIAIGTNAGAFGGPPVSHTHSVNFTTAGIHAFDVDGYIASIGGLPNKNIVNVTVVGGGGGGNANPGSGQMGGGSGGYTTATYSNLSVITASVGAAGTNSPNPVTAASGGNTTFTSGTYTLTATGGRGAGSGGPAFAPFLLPGAGGSPNGKAGTNLVGGAGYGNPATNYGAGGMPQYGTTNATIPVDGAVLITITYYLSSPDGAGSIPNIPFGAGNIAIGYCAALYNQSYNAIAIGNQAATHCQGKNAIAIGNQAGQTNQPDNTIVLNASEDSLSPETANAFYVNPIRSDNTQHLALAYNSETNEIVTTLGIDGSNVLLRTDYRGTTDGTHSPGYYASLPNGTRCEWRKGEDVHLPPIGGYGGFWYIETLTGYMQDGTGGWPTQRATNANGDQMYTRIGTSIDAWGFWHNRWGGGAGEVKLESATSIFINQSGSDNVVNTLNIKTDGNFTFSAQNIAYDNTYMIAIGSPQHGDNTTLTITRTGDIKNAGNSYGGISDVNIKENIVPAREYIEDICKLNLKKYNLKNDPNKKSQLGLIAQDVEQVFPGLVQTDPESGLKSIAYSILTPMLVSCVQTLNSRVTTLESELAEIKNTLASMKT
jgi:hypothetical protein